MIYVFSCSESTVLGNTCTSNKIVTYASSKEDYFNLSGESTDEEDNNSGPGKKQYLTHSQCETETENPNDFWNSLGFVEPWHEPKKIWDVSEIECKTEKTEKVSTPAGSLKRGLCNEAERNSNYKAKFQKNIEDENLLFDNTVAKEQHKNTNSSVQKSFFRIHHKISPQLGTSCSRSRTSQKVVNTICGHGGCINNLEWCMSQYSHLLLSTSMDKCVKIWNVFGSGDCCVQSLGHHTKAVKFACWSHTGKKILSSSFDKSSVICDVETGNYKMLFSSDEIDCIILYIKCTVCY